MSRDVVSQFLNTLHHKYKMDDDKNANTWTIRQHGKPGVVIYRDGKVFGGKADNPDATQEEKVAAEQFAQDFIQAEMNASNKKDGPAFRAALARK